MPTNLPGHSPTMLKIEVFNALPNAMWPFKAYLSQNNPFKTQPQIETEDVA